MIDIGVYRERRARLAAQMKRGVAVLSTSPERIRNRDAHYPFRFDSYFHYLCGFPEPEAVLVIVAGDEVRSILFCRDKDIEREIWDGFRYGPQAAQEAFGVDEARSIETLDKAKFVQAIAPVNAEFEKQFGKANIERIRNFK